MADKKANILTDPIEETHEPEKAQAVRPAKTAPRKLRGKHAWGNPAYRDMTDEEVKNAIHESAVNLDIECLLLDGYEKAFLGFVQVDPDEHTARAVYSRALCIRIQVERDNMSWEDAEENFSYNAERSLDYEIAHNPATAPLILDDQDFQMQLPAPLYEEFEK